MPIKSYRELKIWQEGVDLVTDVYRLTNQYPQSEKFGIVSPIQRAAVSVPSNIAEGHARSSGKEFNRFLSISLGSLAELETQLIISNKLGYLEVKGLHKTLEATDRIGKMIRSLQKTILKQPTTSYQQRATHDI